METIDISELKGNPKNPRQISDHDFKHLVQSIKQFGDLSGIVRNKASGHLVGGHQRTEAFKRMGANVQVQITQRFNEPNKFGTVALGYVVLDGEPYTYREVDWPLDATDETGNQYSSREHAANIAANRIQGEFDLEMLAQINYELSKLENGAELLSLTGQTEDEVKSLLQQIGVIETEEDDTYTKEIVAPTYEPKNDKPPVNDLIDKEKAIKLLAQIDAADIPADEKEFLRAAAYRHYVFDYSKIADYYAHSSAETQSLMENSALVIIDFNKAIEHGFVQLSEDIMKIQREDYPGAE